MRIPTILLALGATTLAAQTPRPAAPPAPPAQGGRPVAPVPAPRPSAARPADAPDVPEVPTPPEALAFRGQYGISRADAERLATEARAMAREVERLDVTELRAQAATARELARATVSEQAEVERAIAQAAAEGARIASSVRAGVQGRAWAGSGEAYGLTLAGVAPLAEMPPRGWAQGDPADSLYRMAYDAMNKGDYRKAAGLFKDLPGKFPNSAYAADAMYWNAHALYRVGSTPDLQEALQVLETLKQKYPNTRLRNSQNDVASLQTRIAGVLSSRGQGGSEIVKRALAAGGNACDMEEQQVRSAALNALMQTDPVAATDYAQKMLARRDDCSRELRRNALFLLADKRDQKAVSTLIGVAKNDPAIDVRLTAVMYLGRMQSDDAYAALEELMRSSDEQNIQREAIRSLARSGNPKARTAIKALVERADASESMRITALDALDQERATTDDVAWLQSLYGKVESARLRSRIINAIGRLGGAQNEKWFATLANNESESIEVRLEAMRRAGQSMDIAALGRLYDQTGQRQLRGEIVRQLGNRKEPESIDKLAEIAKTGTDPEIRKRAIEALTMKKDPRATKLLLELIDRPERE